ncbi:AraC family transcriptional regulator [Sphingobium sp. H39-3-25]|uniref:helix-turn-helix domain-containing protein n=1 Tax=Sphingobium arseniciresistens TaxID=3030834 RepID=UPI0023BA3A8A|nr:AraC family transcriptional regulator [Sphingobium arseniciresistens]
MILRTSMLDYCDPEPRAIALPVGSGAVRGQAPLRIASAEDDRARQRVKIGRIELDRRVFGRQRAVSITPTETMVHVLVPLAGHAVIVGNGESHTLEPGMALLVAGTEKITSVWVAGSRALILHVPRASIQAVGSRVYGNSRRLAAIDCRFVLSAQAIAHENPAELTEKRILDALVEALRASPREAALFPLARSVQRAVDHIRANPVLSWSIVDLAAVAGVTAGTLRRNFSTCLGMSVTQLVLQARIEWVRARLESVTESRSIGELSIAAGFGASGMLNRTYQRHFGETPSQTRTRAFRSRRD